MDKEQSNLMLSDEEICNKLCGEYPPLCKDKSNCPRFEAFKDGEESLLDHLKGLGIVYVKVPRTMAINHERYIPLSDYKEVD